MQPLREALAVIQVKRIPVVDLPGTPVRALAFGARLPAALARPMMTRAVGHGRGGKMPSLHIDLHSGKGRSEVDWLNGAVVRAGQQGGISTPVNQFLNETIQGLVANKGKPNPFHRNPTAFLAAIGS
jgi:2-dehydropantoate 2-reductase